MKPVQSDRLLMLETIREFAGNALAETGEEATLRRRHAQWYLELAIEAARWMPGPDEVAWLERLQADYDDLRAALETFFEVDTRQALRLVAALQRFWDIRGFGAEGLAWVERALVASGEAQTAERAAVLEAGEGVARAIQDFRRAREFAEERLAYARGVGDASGIASALSVIAVAAQFDGNLARARDLLGEALATVLAIGDESGQAFVLNELGFVAYAERDLAGAEQMYKEGLALAREVGDEGAVQAGTGNLAMVLIEQGRLSEAIPLAKESLQRAERLGFGLGVAGAIDQTAMLTVLGGDARGGAILMGAATGIWRELGRDIDFAFRELRERVLSEAREGLGDATFEQVWQEGEALSRSEAVSGAKRMLVALGAPRDRRD